MDLKEIIKEQLNTIPTELKTYIKSEAWLDIIETVSNKNNLNSEQKQALNNEVLFVLLEMELAKNFSENIVLSLGLTGATAYNIAKEIDSEIFSKFREILPTEVEEGEVDKEVEGEKISEKQIENNTPTNLPKAEHLIEDTEGNKDNVVELDKSEQSINERKLVEEQEKQTEDLEKTPTEQASPNPNNLPQQNQGTVVDKKLQEQSETEGDWQTRKQSVGNENKILKQTYPEGHDPYREPLE